MHKHKQLSHCDALHRRMFTHTHTHTHAHAPCCLAPSVNLMMLLASVLELFIRQFNSIDYHNNRITYIAQVKGFSIAKSESVRHEVLMIGAISEVLH